ncbi:MAG: WavE lipopolysaccharide synthesis family protein [Candidatus Nanopelagicaceae bacterium]
MSISLICSCKNRIDALRVSLSSWLTHKEITEIIIVDWNSDEPIDFLLDYDERIKIIRTPEEQYFNQPQPLNLAVDISTGDYILKVDCDYIINPYFDFIKEYQIDDKSFLCGQNDCQEPEISNSPYFKYLRGLLFISRENYLKVNGYSEENTKYYAYEDDEIVARLELLGLEKKKVRYDHNIIHIPHPDKKRVENFEAYHTDKDREKNIRETLSKYYEGEQLEWQVQYVLAQNHIEVNKQLIGNVDDYYSYRLYKWRLEEVKDRYFYGYKKKIEYDKLLKNFPRVNYISLEESVDRQKTLESQFKKFGIDTFSPLLSKRFAETDDEVFGSQVHILDNGTKGCVASHIKMIKKWYDETDEEYGFFCEDDISLESVQYWDFSWEQFIEKIPEDIDCVQLYCIRKGQKPVLFESRWQTDWSVTAYILTRDYAKKIIDQYYISDSKFNLEVYDTGWYPMPENVLFYGHGNVYAANLFLEKLSIESTFSEVNGLEKGYKEHHLESYLYNLNWWKKNQYNNLNKLFLTDEMQSTEEGIISMKNENAKKYENIVLDIDELLTLFSVDTENPELNFRMGLWYEYNKQDAAALSYFIRCAERSKDDDLAYESLIHGAYCYDRQGTRDMTVKGILQQALCLLPTRPEAYYHLSNFSRKRCHWQDCYIYANNGLLFSSNESRELRTDIYYPGPVGFLIEKALSAWDWGKLEECYEIIEDIEENYTVPNEYTKIFDDLVNKFSIDQWYFTDEYKNMLKKIRQKRGLDEENVINDVKLSKVETDIGKIDIILQGGIDDSTFDIVESYFKLNFVNRIIVSTWEDEDIQIPESADSEKLVIVKNEKPKSPGTDNRNLQIVSSKNGLKFVNTKYAAKMRTDQKYSIESMYKMYDYMLNNREHEDQIFVAGIYPNLLFHPRDHIFWGRTCDLIELFDVPLEYNGLADKIKISKENLYKYYPFFVRSETYIGARYCSKFDETINIMILEPEKYLHDNSSGWSQAHQVSQNVVNRAFKSFPREGIDFEWRKKGWSNYPYDDQKNGYGECWAEDL